MSYYLPEKKALFLHIPRTGGTWVGAAMHLIGVPLHNWGRVCEMYRPRKHTILPHFRVDLLVRVDYVFTMVRHPVDYYVSIWRLTTRCEKIGPKRMKRLAFDLGDPAVINEAVIRWKPDFEEWLEEMLDEEPGWVTRWYERYVGPPRGEFCHYVGRTETVESDVGAVMHELGYGDRWEAGAEQRKLMRKARNRVREEKAPHVKIEGKLLERVLESERVVIRRFFSEETKDRRVYRKRDGTPMNVEL